MLKKVLSILGYGLVIASLGLTIRYFYMNAVDNKNNAISTAPFFASNLVDQNGQSQNLSQYHGKIVIVNFWATWCPPCREEMPELSDLHQAYQKENVVVLGVALDEVELVKEFLQTAPVSYPILIADYSMELDSKLGNDKGVLPYTVIINKDGDIVQTHLGRVSQSMLDPVIKPLLAR
jgi:thiol-disulfide isomerase/thioredoxin